MTDIEDELSRLIAPARVHRRLYTDPAIFELEMERIFGVAWLYVGHESQVRNPGDYFLTQVGRKAMVVTRDETATLRVLHNQCAHRGAMVVASDCGHAKEFQCVYHGWTYHLDGRLKAVPLNHGYPQDFDTKNPKHRDDAGAAGGELSRLHLHQPGQTEGQSLKDFLGHMATSIDDMVDRAPDGEIEVAGGVFRHAYNANWKLYLENLCDAAHPWFTHRSSIDAAQQQSDDVYSDGTGEIAIRQMRQNGAPYSLLGNPGRHLDLSERPFLSRRLSRRQEAGRLDGGPGVPRIHRHAWKRRRARTRSSASSKCGAGIPTSIRTCRS